MNLQGCVAWITGGARMGVDVARLLSEAGCRIILTYRHSKKSTEETANTLRSQGVDVSIFRCDLSKTKDIQNVVRKILRQYGKLNILVNLSSIYEKGEWALHLKQNAQSAYELTDITAPLMKRSGGGRVVHIADWTSASHRPRYKGYTGYYVSKAAIQSMVEAMALELAPQVLVNAIAPGPMLPPKGLSRKEYNDVVKATPLQRWGGAEEIAKAVRFLCETDFVTGETIRVDGGRHLN